MNIIADAAGFEIDGDVSPTRYQTGITITSFCPRRGSALFALAALPLTALVAAQRTPRQQVLVITVATIVLLILVLRLFQRGG